MSLSWITHPGKRRENTAWEGGSVWGNWLISTQQLGWEKLRLWLTAPVLQGWRAVAALGRPVLDPHLILPRTERGRSNGLKGKWPAEKTKQPQTIKGPEPALFLTAFPEGWEQRSLGSGRFHTTPKPTRGAWKQSPAGLFPSGNTTPGTPAHSSVHCSGPPDLGRKMLGGCCQHCSALVEIKTLQHSAWSRRCLHMDLVKSWLKISLRHVIFLVQGKLFNCLATLWGDEQYSDGTWNLRAKFDLFTASLHSDFSGCVPLTKVKLCTDQCKATQLLHLQGSKGSIFLSLRPFRWAHLMTFLHMVS